MVSHMKWSQTTQKALGPSWTGCTLASLETVQHQMDPRASRHGDLFLHVPFVQLQMLQVVFVLRRSFLVSAMALIIDFLIFALFTAVVLLFDKLLVSFTKLRSYVPKTTAEIPPILEPMDPVSREVTFMPSKTPYDPRHMLEGKACKLQPGYFKGF